VHTQLRVRAAVRGRSLDAEVRSILEAAVADDDDDLISALIKLSEAIGGVELEIPPRLPMRPAIDFS
jgi:antitoxin FitA